MSLNAAIEKYIKNHPEEFISNIDYEGISVWIKRRPMSKKTFWHHLLNIVTYLIPVSIFYPTVVSDNGNGLIEEAERLRLFAANDIPVPQVLAVTKDYLATKDVGMSLQKCLEMSDNSEQKLLLIEKAMYALINLHQKNLCHGRPALRDMTYHEGTVNLIDLEENPLVVMNIAQAQARDLWLFFNSVARYYKNDLSILLKLFQIYLNVSSAETLSYLKQMVHILKPVRFIAEHGLSFVKSRDLHCAILANKALEQSLKS
ncbi:MAG: hypothetical protein PSV35_09130 [bacterium]|nr:hypothetical protein [bacterium]